MELHPIFDRTRWEPACYVIIEMVPIPSMCPEYEPGPPDDFPFPEFWDSSVTVAEVDIHTGICAQIGAKRMRELYAKVKGKNERISYWRTLKYLEWEESK